MSEYWNENIKKISTYVPGEQPRDKRYIKLNTNENPYGPSSKVITAIKKAANEDLRLYPDPECRELRKTISLYYGLKKADIFIGNGSDEVLAFSFAAYFDPDETILFPDITYSFYPVYSDFFKLNYKTIKLNDDFTIPVDEFLIKNGGIIIPNPNAPTSKYLSIPNIKKIIDYNISIKKVVIIDEAYIDFGEKSVIDMVDDYPNLLVIQTLSKSRALAGLRIGFAIGHKDLIEGLNRVKSSINSYTADRLALAGAAAAFNDDKYFESTRKKIIFTRNWVMKELRKIDFNIIESNSNFLFISHSSIHAKDLYKKLKENGILVRYFDKPRINNFLRVSIGTDKEMKEFIKKVELIIKQGINK